MMSSDTAQNIKELEEFLRDNPIDGDYSVWDQMALATHPASSNLLSETGKKAKDSPLKKKAPFVAPSSPSFSFIDLFAGIGGFRLAMQDAGGECVFSSEWNKSAQETYYSNFGQVPFGDITSPLTKSFIPEHFDLLCGGFPCQPFSICGKKLGFEDTRGTLFFDICEILDKHKPQCCLLENVQHLTKHDHGRTFQVILSSLKQLGYNVSYRILNAKDFGLPQFRDRIFIVGCRNGIFDFNKSKYKPMVSMESFVDHSDNFEFLNKSEYTLLDESLVKAQAKSGLTFCGYRNKGTWKIGVRPNTEHLSRVHRQPNRIYSIKGTHPTIPSQETSGRFFIYFPETDRVRKLTIQECYKMMGFPENFIINSTPGERYKQVGNSVAVPVIRAIAEELVNQELLTNKTINNDQVRGYIEGEQLTFDF